jgi:ankyrin repeat protein
MASASGKACRRLGAPKNWRMWKRFLLIKLLSKRIKGVKFVNFVIIVCCIFLADNSNILAADKTKSSELNVKDKNIKLNKALYWAAHSGDYEKVKNLIDQGAKVNFSDIHADDKTPLHVAVGLGNEAHMDLNRPTDKSLVEKRLKVVELLISKGANVNAKSLFGQTPLHMAKIKEIVELLIKYGANINAVDNNGYTPLLSTAVQYKSNWVNKSVAETLIKYGADINHKSKSEDTALVFAVRTYNQAQVKLLVENGVDVNFSEKGEDSALENAILNSINGKGSKTAEYLITKGAFLTTGSPLGFSELHWAVNQNNLPLVRKVLAYKAPVDYENREGNTPLILAVVNNNIEIASLLINSGADVNIRSKKWNSPTLFLAKDEKMMRLLLRSGADANAMDDNGNSYLSYVKDKKLINLIQTANRSNVKN